MSLEKGIENGREWRDPYYGSRRFDRSCRNHGSCPWCRDGRQHSKKRQVDKEDLWPKTMEEFYEEFGTWA